ncbi:hypothetical protein [Telluribacter sp. SYSU D00476]|uniref:hypothetical protein n=1 Tax=Telluribacter sp. SYSU D00476 TaxID=2811430 RepID=UPI001FF5BC0E|nr:hypothetical protein [Telluribacter sp. SYSU D00476]
MKEIRKDLSRSYTGVRIYLDDLKAIIDVFKERNEECSIRTEKYVYEDLNELKENEPNINILTIQSKDILSSQHIIVSFTERLVVVTVGNNDLIANGSLHKINSIIAPRVKRIVGWRILKIILILLFVLFITYVNELLFDDIDITKYMIYALSYYLGSLAFRMPKNQIILIESTKTTTFFQRKKDDLWVGLFSGLIGAFFGVVGTLVTQSLPTQKAEQKMEQKADSTKQEIPKKK